MHKIIVKIILVLIMVCQCLLLFTGCAKEYVLDTPKDLIVKDEVFTWSTIEGARGYNIYNNGIKINSLLYKENQFELNKIGEAFYKNVKDNNVLRLSVEAIGKGNTASIRSYEYLYIRQGTEGLDYSLNDDQESYSVIIGKNIVDDGRIVLPSVYCDKPVTKIANQEVDNYKKESNTTELLIPDSITYIEKFSIIKMNSLEVINLPNGIITLETAFYASCKSIKEINISSINTYYSSVDGVLYNKNKTSIIKYPLNKEENEFIIPRGVTIIEGYTFYECAKLESIIIPDTVSIIMDSAFESSGIKSIILPDSVTEIGYALFFRCKNLETVVLSNNITIIKEGFFVECENLKNITIPDSILIIKWFAFWECHSLKEIFIPKTVLTIEIGAFYECDKLTIFCEIEEKPENWDEDWNGEIPIVWGNK